MTTLAQLQVMVSRDLRDTGNDTFSLAQVTDLINAGIVEISRVAPLQFQEDITPTGAQEYDILDGSDHRVRLVVAEIWKTASGSTPAYMVQRIPPMSEGIENSTQAGWKVWNGTLYLPYNFARFMLDATYTLRLWGYTPYAALVNSGDVADLDYDKEWGVREFAVFSGFERLLNERALYAQWQGDSNNTDVSMAQLIGMVNIWQSRWDRRRRQLWSVRELS